MLKHKGRKEKGKGRKEREERREKAETGGANAA
jgi:hypothetical protein